MDAVLIGLGHSARAGKDAAATVLCEEYGFTRIAFADALRDFVLAVRPDVKEVIDALGWEKAKQQEPWTRDVLVAVGNHARQLLGEDVWVRAAFHRIQVRPSGRYVITDVRYPNEAVAIKERNGYLIRVVRPGFVPLSNIADQALIDFDGWDATVVNNRSIPELAADIADLVGVRRLSDL